MKEPPDGGTDTPLGNIFNDNVKNPNPKMMETDKISPNPQEEHKNRKINLYKKDSLGPFIAVIQSKRKENAIGRIHPLVLAKEIHSLKLTDKGSIKRGKNKLIIEFNNPQGANNFINNEYLKNKGRGISKDLEIQELIQNSSAITSILNIKRFNRKIIMDGESKYVATGTCLFTFEGKILPKSINIYGLEVEVVPYIIPVIQCRNCYRYGHKINNCKGKKICANCGIEHNEICKSITTKCINCNDNSHRADSDNCPEFKRQKQIRLYMSLDHISFFEADKIPKINNTHFSQRGGEEFPQLRITSTPINFTPISYEREHFQNNKKKTNLLTVTLLTARIKRGKLLTKQGDTIDRRTRGVFSLKIPGYRRGGHLTVLLGQQTQLQILI